MICQSLSTPIVGKSAHGGDYRSIHSIPKRLDLVRRLSFVILATLPVNSNVLFFAESGICHASACQTAELGRGDLEEGTSTSPGCMIRGCCTDVNVFLLLL
jgi:hypothetical protein